MARVGLSRAVVAVLVVWCWLGETALLAQQVAPETTSAPASPVVQTYARSFIIEAAIVIVMIGLALFVVCRASNRN